VTEEAVMKSVYTPDRKRIYKNIVEDLSLDPGPVSGTIELLLGGCTVPFIARYRKERTGGLDEVQIRDIREKLHYYAELEQRKETVLGTIDSQGKLTAELEEAVISCRDRHRLEDLYLPYKPKRSTRAAAAREKGLGALAGIMIRQEPVTGTPEETLRPFIDVAKGVPSAAAALSGAIDIVAETVVEDADMRGRMRGMFEKSGLVVTKVREEWKGRKSKFEDYYNASEYIRDIPAHRLLAIRRGSAEKVISWRIEIDKREAMDYMETRLIKDLAFMFAGALKKAVELAYSKIAISVEFDVFSKRLQAAEEESIRVFSKNLENLLLEPPAGHKVILAIDPGFRTGCKMAVIDAYGRLLEHTSMFPHPPQECRRESAETLLRLIKRHKPMLIAVGNGTASRETEAFARAVLKRLPDGKIKTVSVSEAGASVYSASDVAREEFPDLDVTIRGAVSIARRLQDPLSELVKIDPKSIGVGQYQHDVNQANLRKSLQSVTESCVNFVGVEVNTASKELLTHVAGVGPSLAREIVRSREKNGPFRAREEFKNVFMLGEKVFEQCAGFLRIRGSVNPLDNSAIHPESYPVVERMAADLGLSPDKLIGNDDMIARIRPADYVTEETGLPTIKDIVKELRKPGLDPRKKFENVEFRPDITDISDLKADMRLSGKVTNVTNFGAFVDVGVHQDGLVHISNLSSKFVNDPHEVVAVGDRVRVKVLSVDEELGQIDLQKI